MDPTCSTPESEHAAERSLLAFWGKVERVLSGLRVHPAIHHLIDVGCAAEALYQDYLPAPTRRLLAEGFRCDQAEAASRVAVLAALHDLGKISPGFQYKVPGAFKGSPVEYPSSLLDEGLHGDVTFKVLGDHLAALGLLASDANVIASVVGGHHGTLVSRRRRKMVLNEGAWKKARSAAIALVLRLWRVDEQVFSELKVRGAWPMLLAGLIAVSDWLASDPARFPFSEEGMGASERFVLARDRAKTLIRSLGWRNSVVSTASPEFGELFPHLRGRSNSLQRVCRSMVEELGQPYFLLVEAPTGSGKTEAALWCADVTGRQSEAPGIYCALPTQATSNQMFLRLGRFLQQRHPDRSVPYLLLHGLADLQSSWRGQAEEGKSDPEDISPTSVAEDAPSSDESAVALEWFLGRKRGLVAPYGVGTIDQILLAALPVRHVFVRLFGLAGKTVIIDEVHAYDTYMSKILDRLLSWLAACGTSVILLSATLPRTRRRELVAAYGGEEITSDLPYPRVVLSSKEGTRQMEVSGLPSRRVQIESLPKRIETVCDFLATALHSGGCASWICNTVKEAQEGFAAIRESEALSFLQPEELVLFHSRFPAGHRFEIEKRLFEELGPVAGESRPRRRLIVATQVIEQSLDLDFDLMISDLAPMDLLLQRMGRLHRHDRSRPAGFESARFLWLLPDEDPSGVPQFGPSAFIYPAYLLNRTLQFLRRIGDSALRLPEDVEEAIEFVYGEGMGEDSAWEGKWKAEMEALHRDMERKARRLHLPDPLGADGWKQLRQGASYRDGADEVQGMTRLGRPTVNVLCLHELEGRLFFDGQGTREVPTSRRPSRPETRELLGTMVRLDFHRFEGVEGDSEVPDAWKRAPLLRDCKIARFRHGRFSGAGGCLHLDPHTGLRFE